VKPVLALRHCGIAKFRIHPVINPTKPAVEEAKTQKSPVAPPTQPEINPAPARPADAPASNSSDVKK
jgi:hypothetical protein